MDYKDGTGKERDMTDRNKQELCQCIVKVDVGGAIRNAIVRGWTEDVASLSIRERLAGASREVDLTWQASWVCVQRAVSTNGVIRVG